MRVCARAPVCVRFPRCLSVFVYEQPCKHIQFPTPRYSMFTKLGEKEEEKKAMYYNNNDDNNNRHYAVCGIFSYVRNNTSAMPRNAFNAYILCMSVCILVRCARKIYLHFPWRSSKSSNSSSSSGGSNKNAVNIIMQTTIYIYIRFFH